MPHKHKHKTAMMTAEVVPGPSTTALLDRKLKDSCEKEHVPDKRTLSASEHEESVGAKKVKLFPESGDSQESRKPVAAQKSEEMSEEDVSKESMKSAETEGQSGSLVMDIHDVKIGGGDKEEMTSMEPESLTEEDTKSLSMTPEPEKHDHSSKEKDRSLQYRSVGDNSSVSSSSSYLPSQDNANILSGKNNTVLLKKEDTQVRLPEKKEYTEMKPALMEMNIASSEEFESLVSCKPESTLKKMEETATQTTQEPPERKKEKRKEKTAAKPVKVGKEEKQTKKADLEPQPSVSSKKESPSPKREPRAAREKSKVFTPEQISMKMSKYEEKAITIKTKASPSKDSAAKVDTQLEEEIQQQMEDTYDIRRSFITLEMPTVATLKLTYPNLFKGKQMLQEFQRITNIDIDITIQEYCVKYASKIIECARTVSGTMNIIRQAEAVKMQNIALRQYWDMVTALCLISLLLKENLVEMVREIEEDEEVDPKGKIVPILISKGPLFKSDEFVLVVEEEIVQECEEFTIAFAMLFASYWVFNMQYPKTLHHTYNFIQKVILHLKDGTPIPPPCKQLMQKLNKADVMQASSSRFKSKSSRS